MVEQNGAEVGGQVESARLKGVGMYYAMEAQQVSRKLMGQQTRAWRSEP